MIPCLTICQNRAASDFVLINHSHNRELGCAEEWGPLIHLDTQEMKERGLELVLQGLGEYGNRRKDGRSELESMDEITQREFDRAHKHVTVSLQRGPEIWLGPMHYNKSGGMESRGEAERIVIKLPATQDAFFAALSQALNLAD